MTDDLTLNMDAYLPLRDVVFNTLREAILKGELKPGERLMELQLAAKLGVSRTPIREAIRKLELEGLVLMIPRKGAEVAEITIKDLEDVLEVRAALEELAVCDACENITEEQILALKEAADNFQAALESDDLVKCAETDMAFHEIIYSATNNKRLLQILNNLREQMYRYRMEYVKDIRQRSNLVEEHRELLDAISSRDSIKAKELMKTHLLNQQQEVINNIQEA